MNARGCGRLACRQQWIPPRARLLMMQRRRSLSSRIEAEGSRDVLSQFSVDNERTDETLNDRTMTMLTDVNNWR